MCKKYNFLIFLNKRSVSVKRTVLLKVVTDELPRDDARKKDFFIRDAEAQAVIIQGISDKHLDIIKNAKTG